MRLRILFFHLFFFNITLLFAQQVDNPYHIKKSKHLFGDRCKEYTELTKKSSAELRFDVRIDGGQIFIVYPSDDHLAELIDDSRDGFAIDIIHYDQIDCGAENNINGWPNRGMMLPPVYKKQIEQNKSYDIFNNIRIYYGPLPLELPESQIECNLMILQQRALCDYTVIANMDFENWDLLETPLLWYEPPKIDSNTFTFRKEFSFEIPFDKNKSVFSHSDILTLYDSLRLSDYTIKEIYITAYTSVEGDFDLNRELQKDRAQSIIDALQSYQIQKMQTQIQTKENWPQFAKDIRNTPFDYLKQYSKEQVRDSLLRNKELLDSLEPILARQRKAEVKIVLEKEITLAEDPEKLKEYLEYSIAEKNINQALIFQGALFDQIRNERVSDNVLEQIEVPRSSAFGPLFNNILLFNWERANWNLIRMIYEFEQVQKLMPNEALIKHNILALKLKAWAEGPAKNINREILADELIELEKTELSKTAINKLRINYNILLSQYLSYEKDFAGKKRAVRDIYHYYRESEFNDEELLRLGKFLAFNSEFKLAREALQARVIESDVNEDLVFYYIKLASTDQKAINSGHYMEVLDKAKEMNSTRFCELFLPKPQGGYTFQLRTHPKFNQIYCETCE